MKYKALITDVDGTLMKQGLHHSMDALPSKRVTTAVRKAQKKLAIGVASGRPVVFIQHLFTPLHMTGPCITNNGGAIFDPTTIQPIWTKPLEIEDLFEIEKQLRSLHVTTVIDEVFDRGIPLNATYKPNIPINLFTESITEKQLIEIKERLKHIPTIAFHQVKDWKDHSLWGLAITHIEATKQHAILQVAEILGIEPHEMIGVGDGYNDFPLLMACGLKVAMGNAVPELKEIADYVAPTVDEDGLADVIEKFVLS